MKDFKRYAAEGQRRIEERRDLSASELNFLVNDIINAGGDPGKIFEVISSIYHAGFYQGILQAGKK